MEWQIRENDEYGYFEVWPKPDDKFLEKYYREKYFQDNKGFYSHSYSEDELKFIDNKLIEKYHIIGKHLDIDTGDMLDVGCGEGFTLSFFASKSWKVTGTDYSDYGISQHNPHLVNNFIKGEVYEVLKKLRNEKKKFDLVWVGNVLEHVPDPELLINTLHAITRTGGIIVIDVPNDFSQLQIKLEEGKMISDKYWLAYPDHLNYFSRSSLTGLMEKNNWQAKKIIADFPIEWSLVNPNSNYIIDRGKGKDAHRSRVFLDNFFHETASVENIVHFYESLSVIGQGRSIIGFFQKN